MSATENVWERRKDTTSLTSKEPVAQRKPVWEREKGVVRDIGNVAPSALRTGVELAPSLSTQSEWIPALTRWVIENSPFMDEEEIAQTLAEFDAANQPFKEAIDRGPIAGIPNPTKIENVQKYVTDPLLGPSNPQQAETLPGEMVKRTLEIAPSIFMGPGGLAQKSLISAGSGVGGPGASALAEQAGLSPAWQKAADIGGTLAGGVSPMAYNRLVNPHPIPPSRQPAVDLLRTRNVPLSVGQQTGNERLLRRELNAGGPEAWDQQPAAFTRAAAEEQGGFPPGTDTLTNRTMRNEFNRMGAEFDRLAMRMNPVPFDMPLQNQLLHIVDDYQANNPLVAPVVENIMNDLAANAAQNGGHLTGSGFQRARSLIGERIRAEGTDPGVSEALMQFQDALDDVAQRYMHPDDLRAYRTVRAQYRNMLPIEFAKSQQGQAKREGFVDPQSLMSGIRNIEGRREVAAGERPMTELAEAGGTTMIKPNTSGTAENLRAQLAGLIPILGGGAGATLGSMLPDMGGLGPLQIALGTLGAGAGYALPKVRDAWTRSPLGQAVAGRNLGPRVDTDRTALSAMIAAAAAAAQRDQGDMGRR